MDNSKQNFEIIDDIYDDDDNERMSGHETIVYRRRGADTDFVEKYPLTHDNIEKWMQNKNAVQEITNELRKINNPAYRVPKTYITHGRVYEEFAYGDTLENGPYNWRGKKRDFMIPAIAHFLNDMSELRPVTHLNDGVVDGIWWIKNINALKHWLTSAKFLSDSDNKTIIDAFKYLRDASENTEVIFSHNDLNDSNIIVDDDTGIVSFIDFELAGYRSKLAIVYDINNRASYFANGVQPLWEYLKKLPRTTNPNLNWYVRPWVLDVYKNLHGICMYMQWPPEHYDEQRIENIVGQIQKLRISMGRARVSDLNSSEQTKNDIIVPMSHYKQMEK